MDKDGRAGEEDKVAEGTGKGKGKVVVARMGRGKNKVEEHEVRAVHEVHGDKEAGDKGMGTGKGMECLEVQRRGGAEGVVHYDEHCVGRGDGVGCDLGGCGEGVGHRDRGFDHDSCLLDYCYYCCDGVDWD